MSKWKNYILHLITLEFAIVIIYIVVLIEVLTKRKRYFDVYNILMFVTWILL